MKILTVRPGLGNSYAWLNDDYDGGRLSNCIADAGRGFQNTEFKVSPELEQGFANWMIPFGRSAADPDFPWKAFHAEGIALARRLKTEIGIQARVLYCRPWEDSDQGSDRYIEFLNNGKMIYLASPQRRWRPRGS